MSRGKKQQSSTLSQLISDAKERKLPPEILSLLERIGTQIGSHIPVDASGVEETIQKMAKRLSSDEPPSSKKSLAKIKAQLYHQITGGQGRPSTHASHPMSPRYVRHYQNKPRKS